MNRGTNDQFIRGFKSKGRPTPTAGKQTWLYITHYFIAFSKTIEIALSICFSRLAITVSVK
jgi:hypothetical protein